jgi:hypothetical protein
MWSPRKAALRFLLVYGALIVVGVVARSAPIASTVIVSTV